LAATLLLGNGRKEDLKHLEYMMHRDGVLKQAEAFIKDSFEYLNSEDYKKIPVITCWMDLLGFYKSLEESINEIQNELPSNSLAAKRIALFNEIAIRSMNKYGKNVCLNDALVLSMDVNEYNEEEVEMFLRVIDDFWEIANVADLKIGGNGVRGVISYSIRLNMRGQLGQLPGEKEFSNIRYFSPEPISMNMGFMKSYLVESSHELIKEGSLYVENYFLDTLNPVMPNTWNIIEEKEVRKLGVYTLVRKTHNPLGNATAEPEPIIITF
jgi:hypothetical protein